MLNAGWIFQDRLKAEMKALCQFQLFLDDGLPSLMLALYLLCCFLLGIEADQAIAELDPEYKDILLNQVRVPNEILVQLHNADLKNAGGLASIASSKEEVMQSLVTVYGFSQATAADIKILHKLRAAWQICSDTASILGHKVRHTKL